MTVLTANEHARPPIMSHANEPTQRFFSVLGGLDWQLPTLRFLLYFFPHSPLPEEAVFLPLVQFVPVTFELWLGGDNLSNHNRNKNVMN